MQEERREMSRERRREEKREGGRERGGRDGQMEEWDPRDVSFITPPCSLHSFTLSFSPSAGLSLFFLYRSSPSFIHPSLLSLLLLFSPLVCCQLLNNLSFFSSRHLLLSASLLFLSLALVFRFHRLLWRHPSFRPLSVFSPLSLSQLFLSIHFHFECQKETEKSLFSSSVSFTHGSERKGEDGGMEG